MKQASPASDPVISSPIVEVWPLAANNQITLFKSPRFRRKRKIISSERDLLPVALMTGSGHIDKNVLKLLAHMVGTIDDADFVESLVEAYVTRQNWPIGFAHANPTINSHTYNQQKSGTSKCQL